MTKLLEYSHALLTALEKRERQKLKQDKQFVRSCEELLEKLKDFRERKDISTQF